MNKIPKIIAGFIAVLFFLEVLSASNFAYSRVSETQPVPSISKNGTPKEKAESESKPAASEPSTSVAETSQVSKPGILNTKLTEEAFSTSCLLKDTDQENSAAEPQNEIGDSEAPAEIVEEPEVIDTAERIEDTNDLTPTKAEAKEEEMGQESNSKDLSKAQVEENIPAIAQDEFLIFGTNRVIFLYNLTELQLIGMYRDDYNDLKKFQNPRISPDGKLIAFFLSSSFIMERSGLYLMNLDGTNRRRLFESDRIIDDFDFGPKGDRIIYVHGNGRQVHQIFIDSDNSRDAEFIESKNKHVSFKSISCHKQYLYWVHNINNFEFEIRRKNLISKFSDSEEVVYTGETQFKSVKYSVSPDGNYMIIAQKPTASSSNQISILNLQTRSEVGPLRFAEGTVLENLFWSLDGQWIYGERWTNPPELVRFKFDGLDSNVEDAIELELVISGFASYSGAKFVPQASDFKKFEAEIRKIPIDVIDNQHGPLNVSVGDFKETLVFAASSARATDSIVSFNTGTRDLRDINGKIAGLIDNDGLVHTCPQVSSDGKLIAFIKRKSERFFGYTSSLYLMNSDGSNSRKIVDCLSFEAFAFGPDDESILYVDPFCSLRQIALSGENEGRIMEIKSNLLRADTSMISFGIFFAVQHVYNEGRIMLCQLAMSGENKGSLAEIESPFRGTDTSMGIFNISVVNGHVYWHTASEKGFKIWRINLLTMSFITVPELFYISEDGVHRRRLSSYIVSPDGKQLVVSEYAEIENYQKQSYLGIFVIPDEVVADTNMPLIRGQATLRTDERLLHMFWYTDAQGQDWVFAQISGFDVKGLVRCKVDELPRLQYEMVIPDFASYSGVSIFPKRHV